MVEKIVVISNMRFYSAATVLAALTAAVDPNSEERNIYTLAYIGLRGNCDKRISSPCVRLLDLENTQFKGIKMWTQMIDSQEIEKCLNTDPSCAVDLSAIVSIGPERQCSSEAGISFYIPEFIGWTLHNPIVPDQEFVVEGSSCFFGIGLFVDKDDTEELPVCRLRHPLTVETANQVTWSSNRTQFGVYEPQLPVVKTDMFQILANPNPEFQNCKFVAVEKPFYSLKFKKTMISTATTTSTTTEEPTAATCSASNVLTGASFALGLVILAREI